MTRSCLGSKDGPAIGFLYILEFTSKSRNCREMTLWDE